MGGALPAANLTAKLAMLALAGAGSAGALLGVRQQRIMAAHELIETHARIVQIERSQRELRARIAERLSPDALRQLASAYGPLETLPPEWCVHPALGPVAMSSPDAHEEEKIER